MFRRPLLLPHNTKLNVQLKVACQLKETDKGFNILLNYFLQD